MTGVTVKLFLDKFALPKYPTINKDFQIQQNISINV